VGPSEFTVADAIEGTRQTTWSSDALATVIDIEIGR
jgi:hypothetical protein